MNTIKIPDKYKKIILPLILSSIYFPSIGHHAIRFWEKPARIMLGLWIVCVPLLAWILILIIKQIQSQHTEITRKQFFIFIIPTLLLSAVITWRYYDVPQTFHSITITPVIAQSQKVELVEIKANGRIIPPSEKTALGYGWQMKDGILVANSQSQPLTISFKTEVNAPVIVLFYTSPQSGKVGMLLEKEQIEMDLESPEYSLKNATFYVQSYRGISNWIFIPLLVVADIFTIGSLFLFILFLQQMGQTRISQLNLAAGITLNHRANISILLVISGVLNLLNALAVPLMILADSPSYLHGAIHWLEFGNLDGVSMIRGPGSTFLFAPFIFLFGRNPWGMKTLLHLLAIACVPVSYRIGWQLGKNQWVAFACGLATALSPDIFIYSNILMSDLPNVFFVLVFCTLLISALETFEFGWVMAAMLMGSFAVLFRSENITLLVVGAGALFVSYIWQGKTKGYGKPARDMWLFGLALITAILPLLWWSAHNQRVYGFFGLSNYAGEVFYDGWVYFGDASGLAFTDQNSPAVKEIQTVIDQYPIVVTDKTGAPTGWQIYPSLIKAGYTTEQSIGLLKQAAWDSIKKDWRLSYQLLLIKIREGLQPKIARMLSLPLPTESYLTPKMDFFDQEELSIPTLILAQRKAYEYMQGWYDLYFPWWVYLCLYAIFFSLYRSPGPVWLTFILIIGTRVFIPNIMGLSHWRYTVAGLMPLQILAINWIAVLVNGGTSFIKYKNTIEIHGE